MLPGATAAVVLLMAATAPAVSPGMDGLLAGGVDLRDEVSEPFFAFVIFMTAHDSLGTWTAADVIAFGEGRRVSSAFPLATALTRLTREVVPEAEQVSRRGVVSRRRWIVELPSERVEMPMPFRFLGYRPGKLSCKGPLVMQEWRPGRRQLALADDPDREPYRWAVSGLTVYQITAGWVILDVHAWLDRMMGSALDDGASEGFVVARVSGQLVAVGNSTNRAGRRLYGELDLRTGNMDSDSRPLVLAMSRYARHWTRPPDFDVRALWAAYEGRSQR
jgi:hypothetical protein